MERIRHTSLLSILLLFLSISTIAPRIQALSTPTEPTTTFYIQNAINQAPPGATIQIPCGTYSEILRIDKPLHLKGHHAQTFLTPTSAENGYGIWITSQGVRLSDLDITNHAPGLYTTAVKISAANTILENCTIHHTPIGVAVWSTHTTITHCQFTGCDDEGIVLLGSHTRPCSNTTISSCLFSENCDGIELQYATHTLITDCRFQSNTHAGIDAITADNTHNTIKDCTFSDNDAFGIYLSRSQQTLITDCEFSGDTLAVHAARDNTLRNSTGASIHLLKDATLSIDHCTELRYTETTTQQNTYEAGSQPLHTTTQKTTLSWNGAILQHLRSRFPLIRILYEHLYDEQT